MNRQKLILSLLLVFLAAALVWSYLHVPRQKSVANLPVTPGVRTPPAKGGSAVQADETKLRLDLLDREPSRFSGYQRNIFQPLYRAEAKFVPPPIPKIALPPPVVPAVPPAPAPPPPPPTPEQLARQDMAQYTFLGFLKKGAKKIIFLAQSRGSNKEFFLVKKGDRLADKYVVSDITDNALTIKAVPGGNEVSFPLVENKTLAAP